MFDKSIAAALLSLHDHLYEGGLPAPITLHAASALLASVGLHIAPATLRRYAAGSREPVLPATKRGKVWVVTPDEVTWWALKYRAAPKVGRRHIT